MFLVKYFTLVTKVRYFLCPEVNIYSNMYIINKCIKSDKFCHNEPKPKYLCRLKEIKTDGARREDETRDLFLYKSHLLFSHRVAGSV